MQQAHACDEDQDSPAESSGLGRKDHGSPSLEELATAHAPDDGTASVEAVAKTPSNSDSGDEGAQPSEVRERISPPPCEGNDIDAIKSHPEARLHDHGAHRGEQPSPPIASSSLAYGRTAASPCDFSPSGTLEYRSQRTAVCSSLSPASSTSSFSHTVNSKSRSRQEPEVVAYSVFERTARKRNSHKRKVTSAGRVGGCDAVNDSGQSPLQIAAASGFVEGVRILLDGGAAPNVPDERGRTPLHLVCMLQDQAKALPAIQMLLNAEADPNVQDDDLLTPLHIAAATGWDAAVLLLLEHGATVHYTDIVGNTPLHTATAGAHLRCMQLLVEWRAGRPQTQQQHTTSQAETSNEELPARNIGNAILTSMGTVVTEDEQQPQREMRSVLTGPGEVTPASGIDSQQELWPDTILITDNIIQGYGLPTTACVSAVEEGSVASEQVLENSVEEDWVVCYTDEGHVYYYNNTHAMSQWECPWTHEVAATSSPSPPTPQEDPRAAVVHTSNDDIFLDVLSEEALCEDHALPLAPEHMGVTSDVSVGSLVQNAGMPHKHLQILERFLTNAREQGHHQQRQEAEYCETDSAAAPARRKKGSRVGPAPLPPAELDKVIAQARDSQGMELREKALLEAVVAGRRCDVQTLVMMGVSPAVADGTGRSLLHHACHNGDVDMVALLCSLNAHTDVIDHTGNTPLHVCAECGQLDMLTFLLESAATVSATNRDHESALHLAAAGGHFDCVRKLLEYGAHTDALDKRGLTPCHYALKKGYRRKTDPEKLMRVVRYLSSISTAGEGDDIGLASLSLPPDASDPSNDHSNWTARSASDVGRNVDTSAPAPAVRLPPATFTAEEAGSRRQSLLWSFGCWILNRLLWRREAGQQEAVDTDLSPSLAPPPTDTELRAAESTAGNTSAPGALSGAPTLSSTGTLRTHPNQVEVRSLESNSNVPSRDSVPPQDVTRDSGQPCANPYALGSLKTYVRTRYVSYQADV